MRDVGFKIAKRNDDHRMCPYCHEGIERDDAVRRCLTCATAHHEACTREIERCTVMGCGGSFHLVLPIVEPRVERPFAPAPTAAEPSAPEAAPVAIEPRASWMPGAWLESIGGFCLLTLLELTFEFLCEVVLPVLIESLFGLV